jgi:predicted PolB exonuclease-like 3'-5' exonuclease
VKFLVLDIETITDPAIWTPPEPPPPAIVQMRTARGPEDGTVTQPPRDEFPSPECWRPIVIGCVLLEESPGGLAVKRVGAIDVPKEGDPDTWERLLLERFADVVGRHQPELVTWNGRGHDLPVLMLRSMRHGIPQGWYYRGRGFRYRFSEEGHCDLMDAMADYGAARRLHLDTMAKLIGCPGKFGDVTGKSMAEAFAAGRHQEIATYCIADAVQTAFLFLRWALLKGDLGIESYRATATELLKYCEVEERMEEFCRRVDRKVLLLEEEQPAEVPASPANDTIAAPELA